jgi:aquaporin Z
VTSTRFHWTEYFAEALGLGLFMVSACAFGTLLEHPTSPVRAAIADPYLRRTLMGFAMGMTAAALIYSPWGRRSGAHMNPATTVAFARLGRVAPRDAAFYVTFQFLGGALGVAISARILGPRLADPHVNYVITAPGMAGVLLALVAEAALAFVLLTVVLRATGSPRLAPWTGVIAGALVALWIGVEAPLSGMSLNPARSFASDLVAGQWRAWWIYFVGPPLGMLAAAELHRVSRRDTDPRAVADPHLRCAKFFHPRRGPCLFCDHHERGALRRELSGRDLH